MKNFSDQLFSKFSAYTATSVSWLTRQSLVDIGYKRLKANLSSDEREPAYRFWHKLKELSSDFKFDELCSEQFTEGSKELSNQEMNDETTMLVSEFLTYPYEKAVDALALATYSWLLCCTLDKVRKNGETEQEARFNFCESWAITMGVI